MEGKENIVHAVPYSSIKDNPVRLFSLLNKYVQVNVIKNTSFDGFVHSIDPITHSIILSISNDGNYQTTVIPGHAVVNLQVTEPPENLTPPLRKVIICDTNEDIKAKKCILTAWLKSNLLPVTEDGENIVVGNVSVLPPYTASDIYAENPVVALRIKSFIERMPEDFKPFIA
ncbi:uncharacterized protein LOC126369016 [Pectinophora gossypiella]|uniref:uncharacterized protein LOC126369016 n=1 Tax=Pectinophora gossypiella TaxID=13191 RepID=UPI00214E7F5F|nr:uncharacterized protein LOC126369016 [Pectinophora gossypiella]